MPSYAQVDASNKILFSIHVFPWKPFAEMDEAHLDDHGNCTVDGDYIISISTDEIDVRRARDMALEIFHALGPVYDADDFKIMVSVGSPMTENRIKMDMGCWRCTSNMPSLDTELHRLAA